MTFKDLLNTKELSAIKLVAGENGITNTIRWLYFADSTVNINTIDSLKSRISGGELFICTNENVLEDKVFILNLIRNAEALDGAGIILNAGGIDPEYIELANALNFPILELPWSVRLVDLSQLICSKLIEEQNDDNSKEKVLNTLLFTQFNCEEKIIMDCNTYSFDISQPCKVAIFKLEIPEDIIKSNIKQYHFLMSLFKKNLKSSFYEIYNVQMLTLMQSCTIIVLFPSSKIDQDSFLNIFTDLKSRWDYAHLSIPFSAGIGNTYTSMQDFRKSYLEADKALKLIPIIETPLSYLFFENIGFYSLLFSIDDKDLLNKFTEQYLGPLIAFDKINNLDLCNTLKVYLQNNQNIGLSSDALFIHRNTMRYRLNKISTLLSEDFDHLDNIINYMTAFKIIEYLNITSS